MSTNMLLTFGITFGIVFMTIVYTLIRYIYSKESIYLSYCFMQLFSLIYIVNYSEIFFVINWVEQLSLVGASLSALVFAVGFSQGRYIPVMKDFKGLIINTILLNVVILTSFYHYMLFEYLPYTIIYAILFISVIFNFHLGFKPTMIYVFGWSFFCLLLFVFDFKTYYMEQNFMDIVLIAFAIEAVLFTLSVAYTYTSLKKQSQSYESMLLQQSKLAQSGEMIANITHQFRQPLNNISYILMNLQKRFETKGLEKEYFDKKTTQAHTQLQFMSKTIDDFKSFYLPSKQSEFFEVKEVLERAKTIVEANLVKHNITLELVFKSNDDVKVYGIKGELAQVFVALFSNAIDTLKDIENPKILVTVKTSEAELIVTIEDNGGGIKASHMNKIYDPYFSTKKEGTGLGLYLVKLIIEESFNANMEVKNTKEGAVFSLFFEKQSL